MPASFRSHKKTASPAGRFTARQKRRNMRLFIIISVRLPIRKSFLRHDTIFHNFFLFIEKEEEAIYPCICFYRWLEVQ